MKLLEIAEEVGAARSMCAGAYQIYYDCQVFEVEIEGITIYFSNHDFVNDSKMERMIFLYLKKAQYRMHYKISKDKVRTDGCLNSFKEVVELFKNITNGSEIK